MVSEAGRLYGPPIWTNWSRRRSIPCERSRGSSSVRTSCSPAARTRSSSAWLARKAFLPGPLPFPLLHIDTEPQLPRGHRRTGTGSRRRWARGSIVRSVQDSIDQGRVTEETGPYASRNVLQTTTLLDAVAELKVDAALGGARRDEEKARAKERVVLTPRRRSASGTLRTSGPSSGSLYNGLHRPGEHFRVFPLEQLDRARHLAATSSQEAHPAPLPLLQPTSARSSGAARCSWPTLDLITLLPGETPFNERVRFRTVGDATITGAIPSDAVTLDDDPATR